MPIYRRSQIEEIIYIRRPISTATTIEAYGSGDDYAVADTMFGDDETVMVAGTVVASDGADLSSGIIRISVNGSFVADVGLSFNGAGVNFYQFSLGILGEGDYTVEARFLRLRIQ